MTNYYKVHLKIRELNGKMFVLCGRDAGTLATITIDPKEVNCKACLFRINRKSLQES